MKVQGVDLFENLGEALREDDLSIDKRDALFVDFLLVRLDLLCGELSEHLDDVSVEIDSFLRGAEALAVGVGEIMLGDANHRIPVDTLVEVVLKVVVVFEEIGHGYFSPSFSV